MTTTKSTIETLREQGDLAKEVSNLTMYMDGGTTELVQHIGFLGDKIEDQSSATRDYLDDIRRSIDKNTEALVLIGRILKNK